MAQIYGDKLLMFHVSGVDSSSVNSHDAGTDIDLGAFPMSSITAIMAEEDFVYIYFANRFEKNWGNSNDEDTYETMEQCYVRLTCSEGTEHKVMEDLWTLSCSVSAGPVLKFDAVNSVYPIENVTGLQIRRQLTTHTIASDS